MAPVLLLDLPTTVLVGLEVREDVVEGLRVLVFVLLETVFAGLGFSSGSPKTSYLSNASKGEMRHQTYDRYLWPRCRCRFGPGESYCWDAEHET